MAVVGRLSSASSLRNCPATFQIAIVDMLIRCTEVIRAATDCRVGSQDRRDRLDRRIAYPRNDSTTYTFSCMCHGGNEAMAARQKCAPSTGAKLVFLPRCGVAISSPGYSSNTCTHTVHIYFSINLQILNKYLPQLGNLFQIGVGLVTHPIYCDGTNLPGSSRHGHHYSCHHSWGCPFWKSFLGCQFHGSVAICGCFLCSRYMQDV